jgi:hypothetical protein
MGRRILTNIAIAGMTCVAFAVAAMWIVAISDGHAPLIVHEYQKSAELRGNHGSWRHSGVLNALYDFAVFTTVFGVLPIGWIGALTERTRRARVVAGLATIMLLLCCAHLPLFD